MTGASVYDPFEAPLERGRLVRRYKRFLADIVLDDGRQVVAHCPNSGSMLGMAAPGSPVCVRPVDDPKRKLRWTWELVSADGGASWIGVNTMRPNGIVAWAIRQDAVPGVPPGAGLRREVPYGTGSRIDLVAEPRSGPRAWIEVKNTTLAVDGAGRVVEDAAGGPYTGVFPDAVTARGAKHMRELAAVAAGADDDRAVVVFLVNRADCDRFDVARDIDPGYASAYDDARAAGMEVVALGVTPSPAGWSLRGALPVC